MVKTAVPRFTTSNLGSQVSQCVLALIAASLITTHTYQTVKKYSDILIEGGTSVTDLPGVNYRAIRGVKDFDTL